MHWSCIQVLWWMTLKAQSTVTHNSKAKEEIQEEYWRHVKPSLTKHKQSSTTIFHASSCTKNPLYCAAPNLCHNVSCLLYPYRGVKKRNYCITHRTETKYVLTIRSLPIFDSCFFLSLFRKMLTMHVSRVLMTAAVIYDAWTAEMQFNHLHNTSFADSLSRLFS